MGQDQHAAGDRLNQALRSVMYRILLAVLTYFLTSSLALANFFAGGAYVQFTIENTCVILASTFATLSRGQDWKSKSRATMASEMASAGVQTEAVYGKSVAHVGKQKPDGQIV
ncbi:hypothetical protein BCR44DRAFT_58937 [Catenaria anguillulae PL171]|uniref:Uncharacterized protein n=1 Tax=Catenaria anguillulae PL171 TaxID=765915 RepID=A0A1Y2HAG0_9FUNG|nr:hypothetical protein BCR44DRAFT_58937 [Catenaria anguillulae PL171]